jgi:hypothetical protein
MHGKGSEGGEVVHRAKEAGKVVLGLETLHPAQISSRLLCSGLPPGAFSGGAGEADGWVV